MAIKNVFCDSDGSIQHLFLSAILLDSVGGSLTVVFGRTIPRSVKHVFGSWLLGVTSKIKNMIYTGVATLYWGNVYIDELRKVHLCEVPK